MSDLDGNQAGSRRGPSRRNVGTRNKQAREAWLEKTLARIPAGSTILDAGAGERRFQEFCDHLDYVSQDFAAYDGAGDGHGLQMGDWNQSALDIVSDITAIPRPDASFDAIMCVEVFEHLPDPLAALGEFARLLRPAGYLILTAPFCSLTHFAPYHFSTGFNRYFYEKHLGDRGFEILDLEPNGNFFEYLAQELRRLPTVAERYASHCLGRIERFAVRSLLGALARMSGRDQGSGELLCFGYHLLAQKADP